MVEEILIDQDLMTEVLQEGLLKCTRQFVTSAIRNVKFHLDQLQGNQFTAVIVLKAAGGLNREGFPPEADRSLPGRIGQCLMPLVMIVGTAAKSLFNQEETSLFIVVIVLERKKGPEKGKTGNPNLNTKNNWKL